MSTVHPTSVVADEAKIGDGCQIGPFCYVGPQVRLGQRCHLQSHVCINGDTQLGDDCYIGSFVSLGTLPAIKGDKPKQGPLRIGFNTRILDQSTVGLGYSGETVIGNNVVLMYDTHIGHDSYIGNGVTMAAICCIGGHCHFEDGVVLSGQIAVHQFVRIGRLAMISGLLAVSNDVPPFTINGGTRLSHVSSMNVLGLQRAGVTRDKIRAVRKTLWRIYDRKQGVLLRDSLPEIRKEVVDDPLSLELIDFAMDSTRKRPLSSCLKRGNETRNSVKSE